MDMDMDVDVLSSGQNRRVLLLQLARRLRASHRHAWVPCQLAS